MHGNRSFSPVARLHLLRREVGKSVTVIARPNGHVNFDLYVYGDECPLCNPCRG